MASRPPTPGVLSRGIGLEGLSSVLAGLWGTGTGSTTLTENIHTIAVTKMGSRRAVELGACVLIVLSLIGKYLSVSSFYLLAILTTLITCQLTNSSKKKEKMWVGVGVPTKKSSTTKERIILDFTSSWGTEYDNLPSEIFKSNLSDSHFILYSIFNLRKFFFIGRKEMGKGGGGLFQLDMESSANVSQNATY